MNYTEHKQNPRNPSELCSRETLQNQDLSYLFSVSLHAPGHSCREWNPEAELRLKYFICLKYTSFTNWENKVISRGLTVRDFSPTGSETKDEERAVRLGPGTPGPRWEVGDLRDSTCRWRARRRGYNHPNVQLNKTNQICSRASPGEAASSVQHKNTTTDGAQTAFQHQQRRRGNLNTATA